MSQERLVVVGASLAGLRAVEAARKTGFDGPIILVGAEEYLPYDRPPLSKAYLEEDTTTPDVPTFRPEDVVRGELGVDLRLGTAATALDIETKEVVTGDRAIGYDKLVIATGATARELPYTEGLSGVHTLRTLDDAAAIRSAFDKRARTVIIGGGFIGSEIASGARKRGLDVTLLEKSTTPLVRAVGEVMGQACTDLHHLNGTDLRCGVGVSGLKGDAHVEQVVLSDGSTLDADLVVVGVGAEPATEWLSGSGVPVADGVVCDETLFTGVEGVYAAGDVARWYNPLLERSMRLEHWTSAAEQGAAAAKNALDPRVAKPYQTVPYFWSDWYDSRIQFVGVPDADEVQVVDGEHPGFRRRVALYREGDRLIGALAINGQAIIMKYRAMIAKRASWQEALAFADKHRATER